ncbi:hypothetical protein [Achromobacter sp. Root565]|uniref:hypothetical protein n=1 Tax=Achromobacter sp. Root565 TaxID=1736564 RepID=UPI0006FE6ED1|nr:hypothetical protein [Achromobacter sp. Root565]KQZ96166.1 hypothetical protein ASD71_26255 [Achromobacter sp. Root565]
MKAPLIIRSDGRDVRFCIGAGPDDLDAADALVANPLAPPEVLTSAAEDRVARIKDLAAPFGYIPADGMDPVPGDAMGDFVAALGALAAEAGQLLEHAAFLRDRTSRGEE